MGSMCFTKSFSHIQYQAIYPENRKSRTSWRRFEELEFETTPRQPADSKLNIEHEEPHIYFAQKNKHGKRLNFDF